MASLTLDWIQLAAALGAFQGVLLTVTLLAQRRNRTANRLLAALMATFTIYLAQGVYNATGMIRVLPQLFGIAVLTPWLFGPLLYLYAQAASNRAWRFRPVHLLHFIPCAIALGFAMPTYLLSAEEKIALLRRLASGSERSPVAWLDPFKFASGIAYSAATVLSLRGHRRRVMDSYSNTTRVNLSWLLWLAGAGALIWSMATALHFFGGNLPFRDAPVALAIAFLVYGIGYTGLRQPEVFRYETAEWPVPREAGSASSVAPVVTQPPPPDTSDAAAQERYRRSGLDPGEAKMLEAQVHAVMEREQPWKDSELTLAQLAMLLDTTPHRLSEVLNARIGQTFYDFVNGYRVREVQRRIQAGETRTRKMLALAMDAGFASKSTFNDAFKKHTSQTPSAFRESIREPSHLG